MTIFLFLISVVLVIFIAGEFFSKLYNDTSNEHATLIVGIGFLISLILFFVMTYKMINYIF